jgi:hypothetical protein
MTMSYFNLLLGLLLASASLASAAAPQRVGCPLTVDDLLRLRSNMVAFGDNPDSLFAKLSHCDYFVSPRPSWYGTQSLLEDMIAYRCPKAFKYLEARVHGQPRDDFGLFRMAYRLDNRQIADYMMEGRRYMSGTPFAMGYAVEDLKTLVDRYPHRVGLFLPVLTFLHGVSPAFVASMIDFIQYCRERSAKVAQDQEYQPSNLLHKVLRNFKFSDDELYTILIRLLVLGARVEKTSMTAFQGFDETIVGALELVDTLDEFKRLYPNHPRSYLLLRYGQEDPLQSKGPIGTHVSYV